MTAAARGDMIDQRLCVGLGPLGGCGGDLSIWKWPLPAARRARADDTSRCLFPAISTISPTAPRKSTNLCSPAGSPAPALRKLITVTPPSAGISESPRPASAWAPSRAGCALTRRRRTPRPATAGLATAASATAQSRRTLQQQTSLPRPAAAILGSVHAPAHCTGLAMDAGTVRLSVYLPWARARRRVASRMLAS